MTDEASAKVEMINYVENGKVDSKEYVGYAGFWEELHKGSGGQMFIDFFCLFYMKSTLEALNYKNK